MTNPMVRASPSSARALCSMSVVLLAIQLWTIAQWSAAFSAAPTQDARVRDFLTHLPLGLGRLGATNMTALSAAVGRVGLVAAVVAARSLHGAERALGIGLAAANALLVLWYVFTML